MIKYLLTLALTVTLATSYSQIIFQETFEENDVGVGGSCSGSDASTCILNVTPSNGQWSLSGDFSGLTATSDYIKVVDNKLEAKDVDNELCFTTSPIDISGSAEVGFEVTIAENGDIESNDYVDVSYDIDGSVTLITNWMGLGSASHTLVGDIPDDGDWLSTTVTANGISGSTMTVTVCVRIDAGAEEVTIDDLIVTEEVALGTPGIITGTSSNNTDESGTTASFDVSLNSMPTDDVTLLVTSDDINEVTVSPATLTFTTTNWDTPQTVTLTGVEDFQFDCDVLTNINVDTDGNSTDPNYVNISEDVEVINEDNEVVTLNELRINEVDSDTPGSDVAEFIELYGIPNMPLCGHVVVLFNGATDESYDAIDLDGYSLDENGFLIIGNSATSPDITKPSNFLQNGAEGVAIFKGSSADWPNGTAANNTDLLDAIVYSSGDSPDLVLVAALALGDAEEDVAKDEDVHGDKDGHSVQRGSWFVAPTTLRALNMPLPVEFVQVNARNDRGNVKISWQTASEVNNDRFEVQKSRDNQQYETIGTVKGSGTSSELNTYEYTDMYPQELNYYRIKQIDIDGAYDYSEVVSVKMEDSSVRIMPRSTLDRVVVSTATNAKVSLTDLSGRLLEVQTSVDGELSFDLTTYQQGVYILLIESNGTIQSEKVIKL